MTNNQPKDEKPIEDIIGTQSLDVLELMVRFWYSPEMTMFVDNPRDGGLLTSLRKLNWVVPFGKFGTRTRWQLNFDVIKKQQIELMKKMVGVKI